MSNVVSVEPRPAMAAGAPVRAIVPQDFEGAWRIATAVCKAGMAPKGLDTPEKAMVAILHGLEVGMTPMAALQSIAVVNGRPTIWGDGAIGLARGSGLLEWMEEKFEGDEGKDTYKAVCTVKRKGEPKPMRGEFTVADAKAAGLWGKTGPWQQYKKRMLQMRARAFVLRDGFADVLRGLGIKEEVEDIPVAHAPSSRDEPPPPPPPPAQKVIEHKPAEVEQVIDTPPPTAPDDEPPAPDRITSGPQPQPAQKPVNDAPSPDDPEAFRKFVDARLAEARSGDELTDAWDAYVEANRDNMIPPDLDDLMSLYRKHETRLNG